MRRYLIGALLGALLPIAGFAAVNWSGALTGIVDNSGVQFTQTHPFPVLAPPLTPAAGSSYTVTTGSTAVNMITGPVNGCQINNSPLAADENIPSAEPGYVNPVTAAGLAGFGTTFAMYPGQSWSCPGPLATGVSVSVNALTSGHRFSVLVW
jgi:hypothetical protein